MARCATPDGDTLYKIFHSTTVEGDCMTNILHSVMVFSSYMRTVGSIPPESDDVPVVSGITSIIGPDFPASSLGPNLGAVSFPVVEDTEMVTAVIEINDHRLTVKGLVAMLLLSIRRRLAPQIAKTSLPPEGLHIYMFCQL
jgi:hypothetical protein